MGPTFEERVRGFLEQRHDNAYTPMEIAAENFQADLLRNPSFAEIIRAALESLRAQNLVQARVDETSLRPEVYYTVP